MNASILALRDVVARSGKTPSEYQRMVVGRPGLLRLLRHDGIVTLAGAAWFYAMEHASTGRWPGGWVFPLFWVAGALFLLSALTRRSFGR